VFGGHRFGENLITTGGLLLGGNFDVNSSGLLHQKHAAQLYFERQLSFISKNAPV